MTQFLTYGLQSAGFDVVCMEARQVNAALSAMRNKTDKNDARGIAQILRTGWYRTVHVKSAASHQARALLSAERSALNFLQLLSAVATQVRRYVDAVAGASPNPRGCVVLDTRKTVPGLRLAQKYAVRVGGGQNQRLALWHGILIKENHIAAAGGIAEVMQQALALNAGVDIQIEVETLAQLQQALDAGATSVLLDNFALADVRRAVALAAGRALLEVSGGVTIERLREIAATGVDRISIGSLTKDLRAVDFSMRVEG